MTEPRYDVLGIGNAIYDILGHVTDDTLDRLGVPKGSMRLVTAEEARSVNEVLTDTVRVSGGSAGNTVAGVASLGGRAAFIGKVADDTHGAEYKDDMRHVGVHFDTPPLSGGAPTATSTILVSPDSERTMNTFLGASQALTVDDIDTALVAASAITFLEGYLFDPADAKDAFRKAAEHAVRAGRVAALTLSDPFCVERHRADFQDWLARGEIGLLFANAAEAKALAETDDFDAAARALGDLVATVVVTRGEAGALILQGGERVEVPARPTAVRDLTGAGDLFAGGFMLGFARGLPLAACGALGTLAASEVIAHVGARPQTSLKALAQAEGLIAA